MAGGIDWFRWHHGSVTDPKFQLVARKSKQALASVIAVWAFVLEQASSSEDRGMFGSIDGEAIDCLLGLEDGATDAILAAMGERGLVEDGSVSAWEKRQPKRERTDNTNTERSRAYRAKQHQAAQNSEEQRHATPESVGATPCNAMQHQKKPRGEESREEKKNTPPTPHGGFAEFWAAFPKKVGRDAALKAFEKRKPDAELLARMLAAIAAQAASEQWRKDGGQFIPNPATWLNQARWEDAGVHLGVSGPRRDSDEYAALHRNASWWRDAGFDSVWSAMSAKCWHNTAHQFRDGKRVQVAA